MAAIPSANIICGRRAARSVAGIRPSIAAAAFVLAGCAYDPPMRADHASATYRTDLGACQEAGAKEAHRRVMASGILFLTYPVSLPIEERIQTRKCLEGKGYHLED